MKWDESLALAVGMTPLVPLKRLTRRKDLNVYGKLEFLNPGGSAKDRPALRMLQTAMSEGRVTKNSVLIESSSGNMAISLASFCARLGLPFICVIDVKTSETNVRILKALGARIERVSEPDKKSGEFLPARLARVSELLTTVNGAIWLNQYENEQNLMAHAQTTFAEIRAQIDGIDYLFCGMSTCGTVAGCALHIREHGLTTKLIGVDACGSKIFGETVGQRRFPGLGAGFSPPFFEPDDVARVAHVSDEQCVSGCRHLAMYEGLLAGASSGGVCAAFLQMEAELPVGANVVLMLHDRGERYLHTVYDDAWLQAQFTDPLTEWGPGGECFYE